MKEKIATISFNFCKLICIFLVFFGAVCAYDAFIKENSTITETKEFTYKGHTFIRFIQANGNETITHSPECNKCTLIFD